MTSVAVVRGEALNPFEMQSYRPLADQFELLLVGRHRPNYEVGQLGLPVRLLHSAGESRLATAALRRLPDRFTRRVDVDRLIGFNSTVRDFDILHGAETGIPTSQQCVEVARRSHAKVVLTCWENIPFRFDEDPTVARRKREVRDATDLFLAVTPSARDALICEGVADNRIVIVPAGVDTVRFQPRSADPALLASFGIPPGSFVIMCVGRMIQEKGVVELVRAVARIPQSDERPLHLVLVGNGPDRLRARTAAESLGCADRVHLAAGVGYGDVPSLYNSADLFVAPSLSTPYWQEQFGMVLVEAMASGRAIVTTSSGSIPEVVGSAANLVSPYDIDALAGAIQDLIEDDHRRDALAQAARQRAEDLFAVDVVAAQLASAYRRVLK